MTTVRIDLRVPGPDGVDVPAQGVGLEWRPTRRRHVEEGDVDYVVLPDDFISPGQGEAEVAASGADWCWKVIERVAGGSSTARYLVVPESADPIDYGDLIEVDPETLDPAAEPEAAWNVALAAVQEALEQVQAGQVPPEQIEAAVIAYLTANPVEGVTQATLDAAIASVELTPGPKGDKGDTGSAGAPGAPGPANTLSIGTVTTGAAGSSAAASITGTAPSQTLSLTIPRGAQGAQGVPGVGTPGADGADGAPGADGQDGASAYEVAVANGFAGTESQWLASLVGPAGAEGPQGPEGPAGQDGAGGGGSGLLNEVLLVGDSNIAEADWDGAQFDDLLAAELGIPVFSMAVPGSLAKHAAVEAGAETVYLTLPSNQMPASGSVTATVDPAGALYGDNDNVYGYLRGVRWQVDGQGATVTLSRMEAGSAVTILPGEAWTPEAATLVNSRAVVVWTGTNDLTSGTSAQDVVDALVEIDRRTGGRALFLTPVRMNSDTPLHAVEDLMVERLGAGRVLNVREFLSTHGPTWTGVAFSGTDTTDIAAGKYPTSYLNDTWHLKAEIRPAVVKRTAQILAARSMITPGAAEPDTVPPTAPIIGTPTKTSSSVTLPFSGATDNTAVAGYTLRKDGVIVAGSFSTSPRVVTGLSPETTYTFEIRARDAAGNPSPWSNLVTVTTDAAPAEPTGLVSQWLLDEGTGTTATNEVVGQPTMSFVGASPAWATPGIDGLPAAFSSVAQGDAVRCTSSPEMFPQSATAFSITMKVRPKSMPSGNLHLMAYAQGKMFLVVEANVIKFAIQNTTGAGQVVTGNTISLTVDQEYTLAAVYTVGSVKVFLNGAQVLTGEVGTWSGNEAAGGRFEVPWSEWAPGIAHFNDVRIYDHALTSGEIAAL